MRRRGEGRGRGRASVPPPAPVARFAAFSLLVARPYTCLAPPPAPTPSPPRARRLHSAVLCPACARPCRTASPALFRQAPLARSLALSVSLSLSLSRLPPPAPASRVPSPLLPPLASLPSRPAESALAPQQTHGIGARPPHGPLYCRSSEPSPRRASQLRRARHGVQIVRASSCRSIGLRNARGHTQPRARFSLPVSR